MSYVKQLADRILSDARVVEQKQSVKTNHGVLNQETGEYSQIEVSGKVKKVIDVEPFVKLYRNGEDLFEVSERISHLATRLALWIAKNLKLNSSLIVLDVKELQSVLKQKSLNKIYRAVKELVREDIVRLSDKRLKVYEVNPGIFFNGDRLKYIASAIDRNIHPNGWKLSKYKPNIYINNFSINVLNNNAEKP